MEVFKEFFIESDLLLLGVLIMLLAFFIPARKEKMRVNIIALSICLIIYLASEIIGYFYGHRYLIAFLSLFTGGISLSIFLGRGIKLLILGLKK